MKSVIVSHPHAAQVSIRAATALAQNGALCRYYTGIAARDDGLMGAVLQKLSASFPTSSNRILHLPAGKLRSLGAVEAGARTAAGVAHALRRKGPSKYDALFVAHDWAVARLPWPRTASSVYAYEDGALRTFQHARAIGIERIWDLPTVHHSWVERVWKEEAARWPGVAVRRESSWKLSRKNAELQLATRVIVASKFVRSTLESIDVSAPVKVVPYGFPVDEFSPLAPSDGPFTVISVGSQSVRKGTPYLLEAWKRAGIRNGRLILIGTLDLPLGLLRDYAGTFEHVLPIPRSQLAHFYKIAHVLAFPTLADGFGLVIQEAMSSGRAVITTPYSGGPECITSGKDGWLVPARDVDALAEQLRSCARAPDTTAAVGRAARVRAEAWTWKDYAYRLAEAISE